MREARERKIIHLQKLKFQRKQQSRELRPFPSDRLGQWQGFVEWYYEGYQRRFGGGVLRAFRFSAFQILTSKDRIYVKMPIGIQAPADSSTRDGSMLQGVRSFHLFTNTFNPTFVLTSISSDNDVSRRRQMRPRRRSARSTTSLQRLKIWR